VTRAGYYLAGPNGGPSGVTVVRAIRAGGFTGEVHTVTASQPDPPGPVVLSVVDPPAEQAVDVIGPATGAVRCTGMLGLAEMVRSGLGVTSSVSVSNHAD